MKKNHPTSAVTVAFLLLSSTTASAQVCTQDAECPGQLICDDGACVSQSGQTGPTVAPPGPNADLGPAGPLPAPAAAPPAAGGDGAQQVDAGPPPSGGYEELRLGARPKKLSYDDGLPIPDDYLLAARRHRGLVLSGAIVLGSTHGLSIAAAAAMIGEGGRGDQVGPLFIPVLGPFITMGTGNFAGAEEGPILGILALAGIAQLTGATLLGLGLAIDQPILVRKDVAAIEWSVTPTAGHDRAGLAFVGRF